MTPSSGGPSDRVGSLPDEAARFVEAVQRAAASHTGPECRACPICQGLAIVRQIRPEAVEHLAAAMSELAQAVRELVTASEPAPYDDPDGDDAVADGDDAAGAATGMGPDADPQGRRAAGSPGRRRRPDAVQRIDISD